MIDKYRSIIIIATFTLISVLGLIYYNFFIPSLSINVDYVPTGNDAIFEVKVKNDTALIAKDIRVYNNMNLESATDYLAPGEEQTYKLLTTAEKNIIHVESYGQTPFVKEYTIKLPKASLTKGFRYSFAHNPFNTGYASVIELEICNDREATILNVILEDTNYFDIEQNVKEVLVDIDQCERVYFTIIPKENFIPLLTFNIYNDEYNFSTTLDER